jgi:voltage-gated potassium channel
MAAPLDLINCALSITVSGLYISSTYNPHIFAKRMFEHWYPILLLITHIYFLIEHILRLYTAQNFSKYLFSLENIVEVVTILPYITVSLSVDDPYNFWNFFVRMLDLLRVLVLFRLLKYTENEISRELSRIIIGALALVVGFTGYIQLIEN